MMPKLTERQYSEAILKFHDEMVECGYFTTGEIEIACLLSVDKLPGGGCMKGVLGAVRDWVQRQREVEKGGQLMTCVCCNVGFDDATPVGGFLVMVRAADGGFEAKTANALVAAVCVACDTEAQHDPDKIIAKAMPQARPQAKHPGNTTLQ